MMCVDIYLLTTNAYYFALHENAFQRSLHQIVNLSCLNVGYHSSHSSESIGLEMKLIEKDKVWNYYYQTLTTS